MHFQIVAAAAVLACAGNVAAEARAQPYQPYMMAVPGMSLVRRDTSGYQPEKERCGEGNTCAEACGNSYIQCGSDDAKAPSCFNPEAGQSCCNNGSGNACDKGFYCTHDTNSETWCCPDDMDLEECAAAYKITGGLETPAAPTTTEATTTVEETTTVVETTETTETTTCLTTTEEPSTTWAPSAGTSSVWSGANSTYTSATLTITETSSTVVIEEPTSVEDAPTSIPGSGAGTSAVSMLLIAAAGIIALF